MNSFPLLVNNSMEFDHIKLSLVHDFFRIYSIGKIPLEKFQNVLPMDVYKKCQNKSKKTWHSLTTTTFFEYMYKVSILFSHSLTMQFNFLHNSITLLFQCFIIVLTSCPCSAKYLQWQMGQWRSIMKIFLLVEKGPLSNFKNKWRGLWSKSAKTITLCFASIFLCVILH